MLLNKIDRKEYPDDWQVSLLDKVAKRGSGHTPDKKHPEYWNGGIRWVSLADSRKLDKGYISSTDKEISEEGLENSSAVIHPRETVVISRDAGVGKSAILEGPMAVSQHFVAWQCDNESSINSWFLYYWLQSVKSEFERQAIGSTIKTIGLSYFKKVLFPHPSFDEQTRIAQILSTWDQAIATTEKLIENSNAQKKALMQQLLTGKRRLPGFNGEWQEYRLGQLLSERKETKRLDLRLLSITQDRGVIYRDDVGRKDTSSKDKSKYKRLCPNDIGYNTMRMWQGVSALSDREGIVSPAYTIVVPSEKANPLYMSYLFKLPKTIHDFYRYSQGLASDTWNLKYPSFSEIKVTVPGYDEQEKIARVLKTSDQQIGNLRLQAENLQQEKKALMQQLLTGKRRVKVEGKDL